LKIETIFDFRRLIFDWETRMARIQSAASPPPVQVPSPQLDPEPVFPYPVLGENQQGARIRVSLGSMITEPRIVTAVCLALFAMMAHGAEVIKTDVAGRGFVADFYFTADSTNKPGILFLGGSEGGRPRTPFLDLLASNGYPTLAVAYFKEKGLPESLAMIPLEYFDKPIQWMQRNKQMGPGGIIVVGASRGAELALLLASVRPEIKGVIALAPSSVVWNGTPKEPPITVSSSWTLGGKPVPFMPADPKRDLYQEISVGGLSVLYKFYHDELAKKSLVEAAAIKVERIHGPVMLASGQHDPICPSGEMGDAICSRLKEKGFQYKYEHFKYPNAGHTLSETLVWGGTFEGNQQARINLTERILAFLHECNPRGSPAIRSTCSGMIMPE
jgi:pimeloyl-ACP methyl ester carboxylesterase